VRRALLLVVACGSNHPTHLPVTSPIADAAVAAVPAPLPDAAPPAPKTPIADQYRDVAAQIVAAATADDAAWQRLRELTDTIGNRRSGSPQLTQALDWAKASMQADGDDNVAIEKVMVPHWVRGAERAKLVAPIDRDLVMMGLGNSIGTPKKGITAPVVVVTSWDDLTAKADQVKGKIVLFDVAMPDSGDPMADYGKMFDYRFTGASQVAKLGGVAMLIRSVTNHSLRTAHTGALQYDPKLPKVPAAAITVEDTLLIDRLIASGKEVKVHLEMGAKILPDAPSGDVIGEIEGSTSPDEVVVLGAHIDSWDVGQGAQDDGTGDVSIMQVLRVLRSLKLQPKRTLRVVLFTNEENGLHGAIGYAQDHAADLKKHVMAMEMDTGGFTPIGFSVDDTTGLAAAMGPRVTDIASLLPGNRVHTGDGDADTIPLARAGVPVLGFEVDDKTYFDYHHTQADTLDKVDPKLLAQDVAALAVVAYVVADMPGRLDDK